MLSDVEKIAVFALSVGLLTSSWLHVLGSEDDWEETCVIGSQQSPINLNSNQTIRTSKVDLIFSGDKQIPLSTNVTNTGHSVQVTLQTKTPITVTGAVFDNKIYEFQQFHFHWGGNTNEGSEHTIDSVRFPLEVHFVFKRSDDIAVLGMFYNVSVKDNPHLDDIVKAVGQITNPRDFFVWPIGKPLRFYLPNDMSTYFTYKGSLTTSPCTEGVTWVVFYDKQPVSKRQVSLLQTVKGENGAPIKRNFRKLQKLNGRDVLLASKN